MPSTLALSAQRFARRPTYPFGVNWQSWEAKGLVMWAPLAPPCVNDLVMNASGQMTPTLQGYRFMPQFGSTYRFGTINTSRIKVNNRTTFNFGTNTTQPLTISVWVVKDQSPAANQVVWSQATGTLIGFDASNHVIWNRACGVNKSLASNEIPPAGQLLHLVATDDGTVTAATAHIYINGVEVTYNSQTDGNIPVAALGQYQIGNNGTSTIPFIGSIVDVRAYNYQMKATDVQKLYTRTPYWNLYWQPKNYVFVTTPSTFLPRLAVLGAG